MRIGIIGGGISGLTSAYLLHQDHDIELLEMNNYIGGHTHTEDVDLPGGPYRINTGFIVFNKENYPNFVGLMETLGVPYQPTYMSFGVCCKRTGLEYGFETWNSIFAQRKNLFSPPFWRMLLEIRRFRKEFDSLLNDPACLDMTLGAYLSTKGYSRYFVDQFIIPFGAAIWSADPDAFGDFPLVTFITFFKNHGFLSEAELLQWYTITDGSDRYVSKMIAPFKDRVFTHTEVTSVERCSEGIKVFSRDGQERRYDEVVLAVHSDQALSMIAYPTADEKAVLGALPYQPSNVTLHTDTSIMPAHRQTWSSWNYTVPRDHTSRCTVTYDMNILQNITSEQEFLVTLNQNESIAPKKTIACYKESHPIYTHAGVTAQRRHSEISGADRLHFAGAYWGYGFHEDGVKSALSACRPFGVSLSTNKDTL
ncbi:MAG: FAD-dependent oxidoreductase [Kiritimatiellae bacterium]|nr:FAD-dependent oxidoreductase [Kiritimatiellia bacterium]